MKGDARVKGGEARLARAAAWQGDATSHAPRDATSDAHVNVRMLMAHLNVQTAR